jgi:hypothetical protein
MNHWFRIFLAVSVLLGIIYLAHSQTETIDERGQSGIWKGYLVQDGTAYLDTFSLAASPGDTIWTKVFKTAPIMSAALRTLSDSVAIAKVLLKQWYEFSIDSDKYKFVYISDLSWKSIHSKTGVAAIDTAGFFACNVTTSEAEITCHRYSRLGFLVGDSNKTNTENRAFLELSTWNQQY